MCVCVCMYIYIYIYIYNKIMLKSIFKLLNFEIQNPPPKKILTIKIATSKTGLKCHVNLNNKHYGKIKIINIIKCNIHTYVLYIIV